MFSRIKSFISKDCLGLATFAAILLIWAATCYENLGLSISRYGFTLGSSLFLLGFLTFVGLMLYQKNPRVSWVSFCLTGFAAAIPFLFPLSAVLTYPLLLILGYVAGFHLLQASHVMLRARQLATCVGFTLFFTILGVLFMELYRGYAAFAGPLLHLTLSGLLPVGYLWWQNRGGMVERDQGDIAKTNAAPAPPLAFVLSVSIVGLMFAYFFSTVIVQRLAAEHLQDFYNWSYVFYFVALLIMIFVMIGRDLLRIWVIFYSLFGCGVAVSLAALISRLSPMPALILFSVSAAGLDYLFWLCFAHESLRRRNSAFFMIGLFAYWTIVETMTFVGNRAQAVAFAEIWAVLGVGLGFLLVASYSIVQLKRSNAQGDGELQVQELQEQELLNLQKKTRADVSVGGSSMLKELTATEQRVYELVVLGKSNREIADELRVSTNTVKFHMRNILQKTEVKNRIELLAKSRILSP